MSEDTFEEFVNLHSMQLRFSGLPEHFWPTLHRKLNSETFDAGSYFSMFYQSDDDDEPSSNQNESVGDEEPGTPSIQEYDENRDKPNGIDENETLYVGEVRSPGWLNKSAAHKISGQKWKVTVQHEQGVNVSDANCIFLIDHAWTYRTTEARRQLTEMPGLIHRMCALMDIDTDGQKIEDLLETVLKRMWRFNQTYSIESPSLAIEDKMPMWYIMDEFGSRVGHSDEPNVRLVPFYYTQHQASYTIMFPTKDISEGGEVMRDYVEGALYHQPGWRHLYLLPWKHADYSYMPYDFLMPTESFFMEHKSGENLLDKLVPLPLRQDKSKPLKVYSEYDKVRTFLTNPKFQVVDTVDEADVLWLHDHFKDYKTLIENRPTVLINQFPYESVLTVKDLLAAAVHFAYGKRGIPMIDGKTLETQPQWLAATFNLRTELSQFVSYFQNREKLDLDNHWIIKPWNLARGLDTSVTGSLGHIIRLIGGGPKIACKYIEDPVLFYRDDIDAWVKFDLRFIVLLRSVKPLVVYVYDRFWLRFALKQFSLDRFDDYEKHFTVFNYLDSSKIKQMFSKDFIEQFELQYPNTKWGDVSKRIYDAVKELFEIACSEDPPRGLAPYPQSRAMYGLDIMLRWAHNEKGEKFMQPVILEANFMPDCARACDYYPDFMNTVFETLFADEVNPDLPVTQL